jgi:hypothetical protein
VAVEDPQLQRSSRTFRASGAHILLLGGALAALGGVIWLVGTGTADWLKGLGNMLAWLAVAPTVLGLVLLVTAGVSNRASKHKPFA